MNLVRWDPFRELGDMTGRLNRFLALPQLSRSLTRATIGEAMALPDWTPSVDIAETVEGYIIRPSSGGEEGRREDLGRRWCALHSR